MLSLRFQTARKEESKRDAINNLGVIGIDLSVKATALSFVLNALLRSFCVLQYRGLSKTLVKY